MHRVGQHSWCWPSGARVGRAPSLFELHRREITKSRVQPASVVNLVDEVREAGDDLFEALIVAEIDLLALEGLHEALRLAVVVGVAAPAHRAHHAMRRQFGPIGLGGVLRPAVGMMNQTWWRMAKADGCTQRRQRQSRVDLAPERVADTRRDQASSITAR